MISPRQYYNFTESIDVLPTLIDRLQGDIPVQLDGRSLQPFLKTGATPANWRNAAHWEYDFRSISNGSTEQYFNLKSTQCNLSVLRRHDVKYVHFTGLPPLLFDLLKDPHETNNVTDTPEYLAIQLSCAQDLLSWRAEHLDQTLALTVLSDDGVIQASRNS